MGWWCDTICILLLKSFILESSFFTRSSSEVTLLSIVKGSALTRTCSTFRIGTFWLKWWNHKTHVSLEMSSLFVLRAAPTSDIFAYVPTANCFFWIFQVSKSPCGRHDIYDIYDIYITLTFMYILLYLICLYWSLVRIILIKHPVFPTPTSARRIALTPSLVTCRGNLWTSPIFCVQVLTFVKIRSILSIVMNHNQLKDTQDYCCSYRLLSISIQQS